MSLSRVKLKMVFDKKKIDTVKVRTYVCVVAAVIDPSYNRYDNQVECCHHRSHQVVEFINF